MKLLHVQLILGIWILTAPFLMEPDPVASGNDLMVGAMIIGVSIASLRPAIRVIKKVNTYLGIWLFLAPVLLNHNELMVAASDMLAGAILIVLSFFRDKELKNNGTDPMAKIQTSVKRHMKETEAGEGKERAIPL